MWTFSCLTREGKDIGTSMSLDQKLYSPKAVAKAIGVSESSLKRWVDSGKISASKTAGGHRRLKRAEVLRFLRGKTKYGLARPEEIGLPQLDGTSFENAADASSQLYDNLLKPDQAECRRLILYLFVNRWSIEDIIDQVVCPAFTKIGAEWHNGDMEVYEERRACEMCLSILKELRLMLVAPAENASKAIGGSAEKDNYTLPTFSVELTLASYGWNAMSLGSNLPFGTLLAAVRNENPKLVWLSISHIENDVTFIDKLNEFTSQIPPGTTMVVGGCAATPSIRPRIKNAICCDNLSQLVASTKHLVV